MIPVTGDITFLQHMWLRMTSPNYVVLENREAKKCSVLDISLEKCHISMFSRSDGDGRWEMHPTGLRSAAISVNKNLRSSSRAST